MSGLNSPPDALTLLIRLLQAEGGCYDSLRLKWMIESRMSLRVPVEAWDVWIQSLAARGIIIFKPEPYGRGMIYLPQGRPSP